MVELLRVLTDRARGAEVAALSKDHALVVAVRDADTVMTVSSWRAVLQHELGVWLTLDEDYPAQLAARDVKTLAALVPLTRVVIEAPSLVDQHVAVVAALLTNDEVNFTNDVADLRGAYNRPAPPHPIELWAHRDGRVVRGDDVLGPVRAETLEWAEVTYFA